MKENQENIKKDKGGRPKKSEIRIPRTIRLTDSEYDKLMNSAAKANLGFSKYCREILLQREPIFYGDGYKKVFNELHRHGVNINQAVKSLNEISITHELSRNPDAYAETLMKNQSELIKYIKELLEK